MSLAPILQLPSVRNVPSPAGDTIPQGGAKSGSLTESICRIPNNDNLLGVVPNGGKNFLTEPEMTRLLQAAKQGRYGTRDYALLLVGYRHGLRVSELVGLRLDQVRLDEGRIWVKRLKGSLDTD